MTPYEAIKLSIKELPFDFSDDDKIILTEWAYRRYLDGWKNAKMLLRDINPCKTKHQTTTSYGICMNCGYNTLGLTNKKLKN